MRTTPRERIRVEMPDCALHISEQFIRNGEIDDNGRRIHGPGTVTCFDCKARYPDQPFRTSYPVRCRGM